MSDLISRSALIDFILNKIVTTNNEAHFHKKIFIEAVKMQPTIEAVPVVHGEWIKEENTWICSVCRKENACAYDETLCRFTDLFCPKCGAKMKGGAE